jgi:hypothetical protein
VLFGDPRKPGLYTIELRVRRTRSSRRTRIRARPSSSAVCGASATDQRMNGLASRRSRRARFTRSRRASRTSRARVQTAPPSASPGTGRLTLSIPGPGRKACRDAACPRWSRSATCRMHCTASSRPGRPTLGRSCRTPSRGTRTPREVRACRRRLNGNHQHAARRLAPQVAVPRSPHCSVSARGE